jgi:hypothetical protein
MGGTNPQIAAALGVSEGTLFNCRKRDAGLDTAIQTGKDKVDLQVVAALYKKAMGGDTTAMIFWLKNRRPNEWRDRHDVGLGNIPGASGKAGQFIVKVVHVQCSGKGNGNGNGNGDGNK